MHLSMVKTLQFEACLLRTTCVLAFLRQCGTCLIGMARVESHVSSIDI